jgi:hypothetical protein
MTTTSPFIRNIRLLLGPLADDQGGGPAGEALEILSDGSRSTLAMDFTVTKTLIGTPNMAVIRIYNLSEMTRRRIRASLTRVRLEVGYANQGLYLLATGGLLSVVPYANNPDYITELTFLDGFGGTVKGVTNRSFAARTSVVDIVASIGEDMPGVLIDREALQISGTVGRRGYVVSGRSAEALDDLADSYGFSWSIQDGVLTALDDAQSYSTVHEVSLARRNLVAALPTLDGPMQIQTGIEVTALLDPRVRPGNILDLTSRANPALSGRTKIHRVDFEGGTTQNDSIMRITTFTLGRIT